MWTAIERPGADEHTDTPSHYKTLGDFMTHGFPEITGLSARTGYAALKLAQSRTFRNMPEEELRRFESLGNAFELIKLERSGVRINEELIAAAQTLSVDSFRQMAGFGKKASVQVIVDGSDRARVLKRIVDVFNMADTDALLTFEEVVGCAMEQGEGNATDAVDCIVAACREQWRQEGLPELTAVRA